MFHIRCIFVSQQTDDSPRKKNLLVLPQSEDDADDNQHETRQIEEITANDAANCSYVVNLVQANTLKDDSETDGATTEIGNSDGHRRRSNIIRPITDNEQLSVGSQASAISNLKSLLIVPLRLGV